MGLHELALLYIEQPRVWVALLHLAMLQLMLLLLLLLSPLMALSLLKLMLQSRTTREAETQALVHQQNTYTVEFALAAYQPRQKW